MAFKPGDKVVFLVEQGGGVIQEIISKTHVRLIDDVGFERNYPINALALVHSSEYIINEDNLKEKPEQKVHHESKKQQKQLVHKVDLHIEQLLPTHVNMTNTEILNLQMEHFKKTFQHCIQKRIKRLHVIHGVGEGVLRREIHTYLRQFKGVEFHDIAYTRNGFGGTEVVLYFKDLV